MPLLPLLLNLIVLIVVGGVLYWALNRLAGVFGWPAQIIVVLDVLLVVLFVFAVLTILLPGWGAPSLRFPLR